MSGMDTSPLSPLVAVLLRPADLRPAVDPLTGAVRTDPSTTALAPAEAAALELGLRLAGDWGGTVVAVVAGPATDDGPLAEVAALGVRVVRVDWPAEGPFIDDVAGDERELARVLVAALATTGRPDLVLAGDRTADRGTGALPAFVAHELDAAQALGLVALRAATDDDHPSAGRALVTERRLDGGGRERLLVPLPAVCSVEAAGVRLRRAPLAALLDPPPIDVMDPAPVAGAAGTTGTTPSIGAPRPFRPRTRVVPAPAGDDPRQRILELTGALVAHDPPTLVGPVDAAGAADALVAFLERHGYLPDGTAGMTGSTPTTGAPS